MMTKSISLLLIAASVATAQARQMRALSGHVPAVAQQLQPVSHLAATNRLLLAIGLPLRNEAELHALVADLQDPASPRYRHFLTLEEFTDRFGPTPEQYQAVEAFAKSNGLNVTTRFANRVVLDVEGALPDIERAFRVSINEYQHPKESRKFFAPDTEPSLDSALPVLHVGGLDNFARPHPHYKTRPLAVTPDTATPNANNGTGPSGNYTGADFRHAYVPGTTLTGAGQIVGLLQYDGYSAADITYYFNKAGITPIPLQNVLIDGATGSPSGSGGEVEVCLDIQMVASMAPGLAKIVVFEEPNTASSSWPDMLNSMASHTEIKQFSCSWGGGGVDPTSEQIFVQMQAQGQSFFNATGDSDAFSTSNAIEFPSDSTNITEVGATTLSMSGSGATYLSETVWQWGGDVGSSGGVSVNYKIPPWQQGVSMATNKGSTTMRNVPDVAAVGDNVYVRANATDNTGTGGTSCAAPLWAGFMALVNQQAASNGVPSVGFANPALYAIGKSANYARSFHDTTTGNNTNSSSKTKYMAVPGYDLCTGWGTPNGTNLINLLAAPGGAATNTPPTLDFIGDKQVIVSNLIQFAVHASDPVDHDVITLSAANLPAWASFPTVIKATDATDTFSGTPTVPGVFTVTFLATDKDGTTSNSVTIHVVSDKGGPPVISPIGTQTVSVSNYFQFAVQANDPSNVDVVVLSAANVPAWASFATVSNRFSVTNTFAGTPTSTGTYAVTFMASDKDGASNLTVNINVVLTGTSTNWIDENFDGGTAAPSGWTFTGIGATYTSAGNFGRRSPSLKFDASGDSVQTPTFANGTNLSFWIKGQSTDASSSLLVEGLIGSTWTTLATISPVPLAQTTESLALDRTVTQLRFTYTKSTGNLAFDDVIVSGGGGGASPPSGLAAPIILAATGVSSNRFTANWTPVSGATGYWLDVATNPAFTAAGGGSGAGNVYRTGFESPAAKGSYTSAVITIDGLSWTLSEALIGNLANDKKNGLQSARVRSSGALTMNADTNMGLSSITFLYGGYGSDVATAGRVDTSTDAGATWQSAGTFSVVSGSALTSFAATNLNVAGNVRVRIVKTDGGGTSTRFNIDDLALYPYAGPSGPGDFVPGYQGLSASAPGVVVTGLTVGVTCYYRAMATDGTTNSAYSAITNVTTAASSAPTNAVPSPVIQSIGCSQGLWRITCATSTAGLYRLEYADSLANGIWSNLTDDAMATGSVMTLQDTNSAAGRFYRFRLILP